MKLPTLIYDRYLLSPMVIDGRISEVFKATDAHNPGTLYVDGSVPKSLLQRGILRLDSRSTKAAIKRQKEALDNVKFGKGARAELKNLILHPENCQTDAPARLDKWFLENLDPDKREAVQRALAAKDFFVLHGPPGTGKTTFITELILQFLAQNPHRRVLLTSQTHIAVDNAIERLAAIPRGLKIIRVGNQTSKVAEFAHKYLLQHRIQDWNKEVQDKAGKFIEDWSAKQGVNLRESIWDCSKALRLHLKFPG